MIDRAWIVLAAIAWLVMAAITAVLYPTLPDRVPIHFGITGAPDAYASRSPWSVGFPVLIALGLGAVMLAIRARPRLAHYGSRTVAEFAEPVRSGLIGHHQRLMAALLAMLQLVMLTVQVGMLRVASGRAPHLAMLPVALALAALVAVIVWGALAARRVTRGA